MSAAVPAFETTGDDLDRIEQRGIQRVLPAERIPQNPASLGTMWFTANFVLSTVVTGGLAIPAFGLGTTDAIVAVILFNILGILPVAFFSTLGPKLGLRQITIARFSFGFHGAQLVALFNMAACLGWSVVNVMIGGALFNSVSGWPYAVCVIIIAALTTVVSIFGYKRVHEYERFAWIPLAITFLILAFVAAPHFHTVATPAMSLSFAAAWVTYGGAILGFAIGWASYASDYSTYFPENTSPAAVFWWTFVGEFAAVVLLELFGVLLGSWLPKAFGTDLLTGAAKPLNSTLGNILLLLIVASVVANNIPNDYSLGLSTQVLGKWWESIPRWMLTLVGAVVYTIVAILLGNNVSSTLQNYLLMMAYWLGPFTVILLLEHLVFRHGRYNLPDWDTQSRLPVGWAAVVAFVLGLGAVFLTMAQTLYTGPIAHALDNMDLGFEAGVIVSAVVYLILRPIELRQSGGLSAVETEPARSRA